jgi:septal ring factor EnvC (AmiA/AmiB activator)
MDHTPAARSNRRREEAANMEQYEQNVQEHLDNIQDVTSEFIQRQIDLASYLATLNRIDFQNPPDISNPPPNRSKILFDILTMVAQGRKQQMPKTLPTFSKLLKTVDR